MAHTEMGCEYPDCPTKELVDTLKDISASLAHYQVFESDVRYIREIVDKLDNRLTKDIDNLFTRMRIVEQDKVSKTDLYAAVAATGTIVGILSFVTQMLFKALGR